MGENLIHNQKENPPKTQQKIYYDTGQTPVLYHYNRKTTTTKILEFNNPFTLLYVEELSHNQANVLKKFIFHTSHFSAHTQTKPALEDPQQHLYKFGKMFLKQPSYIFEKSLQVFFSSSKKNLLATPCLKQ